MTDPPALHAAVEDLYSHPMSEFTTRRKALAAQARKAGDRESAGLIAGLRKPTLSADTLNRLVRSAPDEVEELLRLGADLRNAEKALDAHQLRELTGRRRRLVKDLTDLAFDVTDQATPSASVREEVSATLNAALADEQVAERLMSGVLVTQARWDGFGSAALPELAAVLSLDTLRQARQSRRGSTGTVARSSGPARVPAGEDEPAARPRSAPTARAAAADRPTPRAAAAAAAAADAAADADADADAAAAAEQESSAERAAAAEREAGAKRAADDAARAAADRARRLEAAEQEAAEAQARFWEADKAVRATEARISELGRQLTAQRELLAQQQKTARSAQIRRRAAQLALTRAGGNRT